MGQKTPLMRTPCCNQHKYEQNTADDSRALQILCTCTVLQNAGRKVFRVPLNNLSEATKSWVEDLRMNTSHSPALVSFECSLWLQQRVACARVKYAFPLSRQEPVVSNTTVTGSATTDNHTA